MICNVKLTNQPQVTDFRVSKSRTVLQINKLAVLCKYWENLDKSCLTTEAQSFQRPMKI